MQSSQSAVAALEATIGGFRSSISGSMEQVRTTTNSIQETTQRIYSSVAQFKQDMISSEEVQLAQENIIRIDQVLKEQFGDYDAIRRTIIGVVRDFDINLVRNKTIQDLSEELWLTSSRYWLSYALIAVTAWVNDYPEVAANALAECSRRDAVKASLFFTLLNLRFGRNEAARKWFCKYLTTLDPSFLQNEAAVMIQAYLAGVFGRDRRLQAQVDATIEQWIAVVSDDAAVSEDLIKAYARYLEQMPIGRQFTLSSVRQFCVNAQELEGTWYRESKYAGMLALIQSLDIEEYDDPTSGEDYKKRIDGILTQLVSNYDMEERELRDQQEYYGLVIANNGNLGSAEEQFQEMLRMREAGFNVGRQMINWVLYDPTTDVHVRKFALTHTKEWLRTAVERFADTTRAGAPTGYKLSIDGWEGLSNGDDLPDQEASLREYFETHKLSMVYLTMPNIVCAVVAAVCVGLCFVSLYALIGVVAALGFLGFSIYRATTAFPQRVEAAVQNLNNTECEIGTFKQFCVESEEICSQVLEQLDYGFIK